MGQVTVFTEQVMGKSLAERALNACEESLSQATAGRGDTMKRYPLKTDTQNIA
jgi:hypothetical protein